MPFPPPHFDSGNLRFDLQLTNSPSLILNRLNMKTRILVILIAGILSLFALQGCTQIEPEESPVPWSRPAEWEGRVPGMGGP